MRIDRQAFISYAHIDNRPIATEVDGWVTLLHKTLKNYLDRHLGRDANVWRDERLEGNEQFWDEIADNLRHTAVLVAVLSPRYFASPSCENEFRQFCEIAEHDGGLSIDNRSRIFKVLTLPLTEPDVGPWTPVLRNMLGYEFYEMIDNQTPIELAPMYGDKSKADFLRKVAILASGIARVVRQLEARQEAPPAQDSDGTPAPPATTVAPLPQAGPGPALAVVAPGTVVYLATCSHDRTPARDLLAAALDRTGCIVLPDRDLPAVEDDLVDAVQGMLARSSLSIHLVGSGSGMVPDGTSGKSAVVLQSELAARRSRDSGLARVVWLPDGTQSAQPAQAAFINALHTDAQAQFGADLITGNFEALKSAVLAALDRLNRPAPVTEEQPEARRRRLSLICCESDRKHLIDVIKLVREQVDVTLPLFAGAAGELREANHGQLMACDAVLLYYGEGDEVWKYHQVNELRRVRALRRARTLPPEYTLLGPPDSDDKGMLQALEPRVVDLRAGLTTEARAALAAMLRELAPLGS